jgi:hypothetical protein
MIPADIYKAFLESGNDWADKHGAAELLEGTLKTLKAQLTLEGKHLESCSMAEATEIALSSDKYRDALQGAVAARTEANRAKVRYTATQALFDAQRTAESTNRAAMHSAA